MAIGAGLGLRRGPRRPWRPASSAATCPDGCSSDGVRAAAYCYYMVDAGRVIVGSIFAARAHRGRGLEDALVERGGRRRARRARRRPRRVPDPLLHRSRGRRAIRAGRLRGARPPLHAARPAVAPARGASAAARRASACGRCGATSCRPPPRSSTAATSAAVDAALNLTYSTPATCRTFVDTLVLRSGCGRFDPEASRLAEGPCGPVGVLIASRLVARERPRLPGLGGARGAGSRPRRRPHDAPRCGPSASRASRAATLSVTVGERAGPPPLRAARLPRAAGVRRARLGAAARADRAARVTPRGRSRLAPRARRRRRGAVVVVPAGRAREGAAGWIGAVVAEPLPRALQRAGVPAVPDADRRRAQEALGRPSPRSPRARPASGSPRRSAPRASWSGPGSCAAVELHPLAAPARRRARLPERAARGHGAARGPRPGHPRARLGRGARGPAAPAARATSSSGRPRVPFEALRALGEGLAARDAAARVAGARRALAAPPGLRGGALVLARLLVDASAFDEARARARPRARPGSPFARDARFLDGRRAPRPRPLPRGGRPLRRARGAGGRARPCSPTARWPGCAGAAASGASTLLRQALERSRRRVDLPFDLGWALLVEGDARAAAFWLRGAVRRDPGDAQGRLLLSWALAAGGRAEEAEEQWRAAAALVPALGPMRTADLSRRLERVLRVRAGARSSTRSGARTPRPRAPTRRGEALLAAGDRAGAVSELARAALLDPYAAPPAPAARPGAPARGREREGGRRAAHGPVVPRGPHRARRARRAAALDGALTDPREARVALMGRPLGRPR